MADAEQPAKKSDLKVRAASAVVMVAVAGLALWLGGWFWFAFVGAVALGVLTEWWTLVRGFVAGTAGRAVWMVGGLAYIGLAAAMLVALRLDPLIGWAGLLIILLSVIGTDVGAYLVGRTIGGPKIAPTISPSKTWSGLLGGIIGAAAAIALTARLITSAWYLSFVSSAVGSEDYVFVVGNGSYGKPLGVIVGGALIAVIAQAGDFFESWMKRRAGVKDSGKLIPGHGGLFDRVDGLLAVSFALGVFLSVTYITYIMSK